MANTQDHPPVDIRLLMLVAGGVVRVTNSESGLFLTSMIGDHRIHLQLDQREVLALIEYLAAAAREGTGKPMKDEPAGLVERSEDPRFSRDSVEDIQHAVCAHFGVRISELRSRSRVRRVSFPRMVAMYLCRQRLNSTYFELGKRFGGRDHTTVMSAVSQVESMVLSDASVAERIAAIGQTLSRDA